MNSVFLSYVTLTNQLDGDIGEFRRRLEIEVRMHLGDRHATVFQDSASIRPGDQWEESLEEAISDAAIMIPFVSPAYLTSEWCRYEILRFDSLMRDANLRARIIPVIWVATNLTFDDEVAAVLRRHQQLDWSALRFDDWNTPPKRRGIAKLASIIGERLQPSRRQKDTGPLLTADTKGSLNDLLMEVDPDHLRQMVEVSDFNVSQKDIGELVAGLVANGQLTAEFFTELRSALPKRAAAVDAVASSYGFRQRRRCLADPAMAVHLYQQHLSADTDANNLLRLCSNYAEVFFELTFGMSSWIDYVRNVQNQYAPVTRLTHLTPTEVGQLLNTLTADQTATIESAVNSALRDPEIIVLTSGGVRSAAEQVAYIARLFALATALRADLVPSQSRMRIAERFSQLLSSPMFAAEEHNSLLVLAVSDD